MRRRVIPGIAFFLAFGGSLGAGLFLSSLVRPHVPSSADSAILIFILVGSLAVGFVVQYFEEDEVTSSSLT